MGQALPLKVPSGKPWPIVLGQIIVTLLLFCFLTERVATFDGGRQAVGRAVLLFLALLLVAATPFVTSFFQGRSIAPATTPATIPATPATTLGGPDAVEGPDAVAMTLVSPVIKTSLQGICAIGLLWHFLALVGNCINLPELSDITTTTMGAIDALRAGQNPYSVFIDASPGYPGYKYLPWMMIVYFPLETLLRDRGMLITNFMLDMATAALVFGIARRITAAWSRASLEAAWFAMALYLGAPLVVLEIYRVGVTDLSAVVPLLVAALWLDRRPGVAGFMVGVSIATKLLPGLLFLTCFWPEGAAWAGVRRSFRQGSWQEFGQSTSRYLGGLLLGMVPMLGFWLAAPADFYHNIFEFILLRGGGAVSWLSGAPWVWSKLFRNLALGCLVGGTGYLLVKPTALINRLRFGVVSVLLVLLSSSNNHRNYQLWWIPLLAIVLGVTAMGLYLERPIERPNAQH